jgi:hypothetical protein
VLFAQTLTGSNAPDSYTGDQSSIESEADSGLPLNLNDKQTSQGFEYADDFNTAWRWWTPSEKEKMKCTGPSTCAFAKVIALNNCSKIRATGHVTLSDDLNAESASSASGWVGGSKSKSHLKAGKSGWLELDAVKPFSDGNSMWFSLDSLVCTVR